MFIAATSRREFLCRSGVGLGMLGLAGLTGDQCAAEATDQPSRTHFEPRAKRVIHIFLNGGPSHVDTFDPKTLLRKHAGRELPTPNLQTESPTGAAFPSPFPFNKYGESGIEVSDLFSHVGEHIDDICVIRSMQADIPFHEPSLMLMNCGESRLARPSLGSWLTYGLGSENENLPGFIAMCPEGYPVKGTDNWRSAFLPGAYQGTYLDTARDDVRQLVANIENNEIAPRRQRQQLNLLAKINRLHQARRADDPRLEARIQSFEQAYRMQSEALDAFDISKEPKHIRESYGTGVQARQILMARRLVERGVRVVQVWHGEGQPWDSHDQLERDHRKLSAQISQPIGALLQDLKQRDLLKDTLVIWGGEFGRTPTAQGGKGRDHNHHGFSMWLAGGGVKGGTVYGATDEFGWKAVEDPVHVHDLHATILYLLGLDHERLTYRHAGRDFRLTDVHGRVLREIVA